MLDIIVALSQISFELIPILPPSNIQKDSIISSTPTRPPSSSATERVARQVLEAVLAAAPDAATALTLAAALAAREASSSRRNAPISRRYRWHSESYSVPLPAFAALVHSVVESFFLRLWIRCSAPSIGLYPFRPERRFPMVARVMSCCYY